MKTYKQGLEINLTDKIEWEVVLNQPRYAGGHDEILENIFGGGTEIAHWNEGDYQGQVATAHKLEGIGIVIMTDYYGSCSGCDAYEDADSDSIRKLVTDVVNGAYIFESTESAREFINRNDDDKHPWEFSKETAKNLKL